MKKVFILLVSLFAMTAASTGLKAQEVSIILGPEWNWIGYPYPESVDIDAAFGDFEPMPGDLIESLFGYSEYLEGYGWLGAINELRPGWGYMYYSNRTEAVNVVLHAPASQTAVTTAEPTDITATSAVVGGTVTVPEGTHVFLRGVCWGAAPNPDIDGSHTTEGTGIGSFSGTLEGLNPNTTYYVRAYAVSDHGLAYGNELSFTTTDYAYVDLGLPSGTMWATCNIGANAPEEYGDYFAWGETQPKDTYDWSTYLFTNGGSYGEWGEFYPYYTKYCVFDYEGRQCFYDNLTTLLPVDDAATANWGSGWRMPTEEEWQELHNNTTVTTTTQNGVNGRLFTASNGNSLFLPAAGYRNGSNLSNAGSYGYYWSSSLDIYSNWANCNVSDGDFDGVFQYERNLGQSVRPVCSSVQRPTVYTAEVTDITTNTAVCGGTINTNGNIAITARGVCWSTIHHPSIEFSQGYTTNGTDPGSFTSSITGLCAGTTYYVRAYASNSFYTIYGDEQSFTTEADGNHEYVDLGLPSGLLWATCNVGADNPEDYGDYFAWGETQSKLCYEWFNYQYSNGGSSWEYPNLTKYCDKPNNGYNGFTDNLTTLLPEDDATTVHWGSGWRMPTWEEWDELLSYTTGTWTTQNGVYGWLFTAANGNSLFLPAAGSLEDSNLYVGGGYGFYWSSSLLCGDPYCALGFEFGGSGYGEIMNVERCYGQSIRPVRSASQNTSFIIDATVSPSEGGTVAGTGNYAEGSTCTLTATANDGCTFVNWTENGEVVSAEAIYSFTVEADRTLVANFAVFGGDHAYVDLGLPSGLLWATCNVGADNPEDYGDYFAWGETQPKDTYNWSNYQYCNGSYNTLTKYCTDASYGYNGFTDNLTTLLPEDDAATANWGSDWRMPTYDEWKELFQNTTHTWTTQSGVNGRLFTASNGNSLFLPAAGFRGGSGLSGPGSHGDYWSSLFNTDYPYSGAWSFYFDSDICGMDNLTRSSGLSVRPVRSISQNTAPTGAINGKFTINSSGYQVYFSQGNLQYIGSAATPYWKFADNQWDVLGTTMGQNSSSQNVDRDLFGWGTSGYNHGANCYQPWSTSTSYSDYYAYGNYQYNLYDQTGQADWGYNPISNGGNQANQWRTLTLPEWAYIFNTRTTSSGIRYAKAKVNNVNGIILLPDDWSSETYSLSNTNSSGANFSSNIITASQWSALELVGAVFLPAAGYRNGTSVNLVGGYGYYWSASYDGSDGACYMYFNDWYLYTSYYRYYGASVRLARVAEN